MTGTDSSDRCTSDYSSSSIAFMASRRAETHARFFLPHLAAGMSVVDLGCGPGSITADLAAIVAPGPVLGIDQGATQLDGARNNCERSGLQNLRFELASCYDIPLPDYSVNRVFAHALLELLDEPVRALTEARRILRRGGVIGLCSPDWGGFVHSPPSPSLDDAFRAYTALQETNGVDPLAGRKLGTYLAEARFEHIRIDARYERYLSTDRIAGYVADQLDQAGAATHARVLRSWAATPSTMIAQAWISATAVRPE